MKQLFTALALVAMMAAPISFAQDSYISDELFTYMHSGPSAKFRIIGSVDAGAKVKTLSTNAEAGYSQIIDKRGRKGWIESKYITSTPGLKIRFPALNSELTQLKSELQIAKTAAQNKNKDLISSLETRTKQLKELEIYSSDLNQRLLNAQSEIRELSAKIDTQKDDLLMRYFSYGGLVAGIGLLFGLILPFIIPRRKKTNSGWV